MCRPIEVGWTAACEPGRCGEKLINTNEKWASKMFCWWCAPLSPDNGPGLQMVPENSIRKSIFKINLPHLSLFLHWPPSEPGTKGIGVFFTLSFFNKDKTKNTIDNTQVTASAVLRFPWYPINQLETIATLAYQKGCAKTNRIWHQFDFSAQ